MDAKTVRNDTAASYAAQKQLREQALDMERRVKASNVEGERRIEELKKHYDQEAVQTEIHGQERVEYEKAQGYEQLRKTQREKNRSLEALSKEAGQQEADAHENLRAELTGTERTGDKKLKELTAAQNMEMEREKLKFKGTQDLMRAEHERQYAQIAAEKEETLQTIKGSQDKSLTGLKETALATTMAAEERYKNTQEQMVKAHAESLGAIDSKTTDELKSKQLAYSQKLAAYSSRASDPFYKIVDMKAGFAEEEGAYTVSVKAPAHEQAALKLNVRGDQLVLSGNRQNLDRVTTEEGTMRESTSFQTYREAFPITMPVDERGIMKSIKGDTVTFRVPKKGPGALSPKKAAQPELLRAERPQFPANLPETPTGAPIRGKTLS